MEYYFCEDILVSIFLRLPARSLVRFRCLSRSWNFVFSDPKFIRNHMRTTSSQQNHKDILLLYRGLHHLPPALSRLRIDACFDGRRGGLEAQDLESPFGTSDTILCTAHCVDGILCTFTRNISSRIVNAVVWNPVTKEHKRFPVLTGQIYGCEAFGFGYDSVIGDYKVIHIEYWQNWRNIHSLRLKAGGWNAAQDNVPYRFSITFFNQMATAVNGCLYWIAWKQDDGERNICGVILCFDLERETLREETSLCGQGIFYEDYQSVLAGDCKRNKFKCGVLSLLGNSLCLARTYDDKYFDLFIMEENEMTKTKYWVPFAIMYTGNTVFPPIYVTRNGDMLANEQDKTRLFIFYPDGSLTKKVAIQGLRPSYESFYVIPYVESLISPFT